MNQKEETYRRIKIAGMLFFAAFVLASGPIAGYLIGAYLKDKFALSASILSISIIAGILVSALEAARIIRLVIMSDKRKGRTS